MWTHDPFLHLKLSKSRAPTSNSAFRRWSGKDAQCRVHLSATSCTSEARRTPSSQLDQAAQQEVKPANVRGSNTHGKYCFSSSLGRGSFPLHLNGTLHS
jgi:hypothetical protein